MRERGRVDNIQRAVVLELRRHGASVLVLSSLGSGAPDIVAGYNGSNYLLELKSSPSSKLTADEQAFFGAWRGSAQVVYSVEDALRAVGVEPDGI